MFTLTIRHVPIASFEIVSLVQLGSFAALCRKWGLTPFPALETNALPELRELIYRQKYRGDTTVVAEIVQTAGEFVRQWNPPIECVVPAPPALVLTRTR